MNTVQLSKADGLALDQISWRYYHRLKKKAMEREFSWTGLLLSLSIAFFIVIFSALALNFVHSSIAAAHVL